MSLRSYLDVSEKPQLINTFYGGINLHYQITLDTASEGNFSTRNPEEAKRLIKNIATGRSYEMMDVGLGRKADPVDESPLLEIKEHLDSPHPALEGQNQFAKSRLNQAFTENRKSATVMNRKIDIVFSELMRKFDALGVQIKRLDSQVAENATAIKTETGRLPGRTDANPKRQVNAVLLRSRKRLIPREIEINNTEKHAEVEETGESRSRPINLDNPSTKSEIPRERGKPNTEEEAIELEEEE
ncbi:hypothetical protein F2Q69_00020171 [Brassica cretica]|uniref:Uncharacterized protein n=1 Tax=Brassica cretica TaxID=69181 RepID=A0A8S9Q6L0_BRACR|nr:hypothetical protein F2Q69_00020171 [Brassica cretica]